MKVKIDRDGCIACNLCADICSEVFRMADDGFAEVYSEVSAENIGKVHEAADNCPVSVISVDE